MDQRIFAPAMAHYIIVVHGEVIDAAALPALFAENWQGLATYRLRDRDAELVRSTLYQPALA